MDKKFEYEIKSKNDLLIVTLKGALNKEAQAKLETLNQEILSAKAKINVLYFRDVLSADSTVFRHLTLIQQNSRSENKKLFVIGLTTSLKQLLNEKGIIRINETKNTLEEVLTSK